MLNLNDIHLFVRVADHGGFAAAGRALGLPKSSLSRRVIELEARLGARLIHRTSRRFALTEVGEQFYERAVAMVAEAEAAEDVVKRRLGEPSGPVRFSVSVAIAQFALASLLPRFVSQHPRVVLVQHATNRGVDLVEEGFDIAIRAHARPLPDSSLIARRIVVSPRILVASPDYLERFGEPHAPAEVAEHAGLMFGGSSGDGGWTLVDAAGATVEVSPPPRMWSDDLITLKTAAEAGLGVAAAPAFMCRAELRSGRLRRVLPQWTAGGADITLLTTSRRNVLPSVRAFTDFLAAELPSAMSDL